MNSINILSGDNLVRKGVTRLDANLPEIGLKDVVPNDSWLEQKQIQAALEAKKHLIEVERIEKRGSLSHAEWNNDLKLAEVIQKCGGYWQYLGHNVGRTLYLRPEEALFLMEINCLQLKYGGAVVSLQQAYALLLQESISLLNYKVYSSLSRIGFKVYRHKSLTKNILKTEQTNEPNDNTNTPTNDKSQESVHNISSTSDCSIKDEVSNSKSNNNIQPKDDLREANNVQSYNTVYKSYQHKLSQLRNRKLKQCCNKKMHDFFDNIPDLLEKRTVNLKVPEARYVPQTMVLKESYTINLSNIPLKCKRSSSTSLSYSSNDEANGSHIKRLRTASTSGPSHSTAPNNSMHLPQMTNNQFRPFIYVRPPTNFNYFNMNMLFHRPYIQQIFFPSLLQASGAQFFQRQQFNNYNSFNFNRGNRYPIRTNTSNQEEYLERIKNLALRLKHLVARGNVNQENTQSLQRLLNTYNSRYKTNLRLGPYFDIVNGETVVETIELDLEDDEPQSKKRKTDDECLEENLKSIKLMALDLKRLEMNNKATPRHRRTFSKLLKTFNRCYNVDYYLNNMYEIMNRRHITLDSSSDTDCVIQEEKNNKPVHKTKKSKKLRNPFNILKRLSEKQDLTNESTRSGNDDCIEKKDNKYSDIIKEVVHANWLPNENDFGRVELCEEFVIDPFLSKSKLLYDFCQFKTHSFDNWVGLKVAFLENLKESIVEFHDDITMFQPQFDMECLVKPEDCTDTQSVLQKLRIINATKETSSNSILNIDFDVYNRDVEGFKKTDPPTPHFRVICLDESSNIPSAKEVEALHSQYEDNVPIVFALVSISSVSYLQVRPTEIPVHTPSNSY